MTAPTPSGGPSPLRVGGLALLGVGAVAAIIGIGTAVTGGGDSTVASPPPTSNAAPAPTAVVPPPSPDVPVPSFGPTPTNAITAPPAAPGAGTDGSGTGGVSGSGGPGASGSGGSGGPAGSSGGGQTVVKSPVRVYNNSTIKGLAARAATDFRDQGWTVSAVANYPYGNIPTSTVYYRPGTAEQAGAQAMGKEFGMRVEQRFTGLDDASPGLIVIVTNDYQKRG